MADLKFSELPAEPTPQVGDQVAIERAGLTNHRVTMADLATFLDSLKSIAEDTILGRAIGAGAGVPQELTGENVMDVIADALDISQDLAPVLGGDLDAALGEIFNLAHLSLSHTSLFDGDIALEILCSTNGFGDSKCISIQYNTGNLSAGKLAGVNLVNVNASEATGGIVTAYQALTSNGSPATICGLYLGPGVGPILHHSGPFVDMDSALVLAVDRLTEFITSDPSGPNNVNMFVADNDDVTIGNATKFSTMAFILETEASGGGIQPVFEYSTGIGTWAVFVPSDGTNGMQNSGAISWLLDNIPGWLPGLAGEFLIRITRTRNSLATIPKEDLVQISVTTVYEWDALGNVNINDLIVASINGGLPGLINVAQEWNKSQNFNAVPLTGLGVDMVLDGDMDVPGSWTLGSGWSIAAGLASCDGTQVADSDLTQTPAIAIVAGKTYQVTYTVSGRTVGNVTAVIGDTEGTDRATNATFVENVVAGAGADIDIRADLDFDGDIDNVIVKLANVSWNLEDEQIATLVLDGDLVLDNATNMVDGLQPLLRVNQDGVGGWSLTYGTAYKFPGGVKPDHSTGGPNAEDEVGFDCKVAHMNGNFAQDYS